MRSTKRIFSWSLYIVVICATIFALAANFLIIAQTLFSPLNVVQGQSMSPVIRTNDAVYVTLTDSNALNIGDIVVFSDPLEPEQSIVHRIVSFKEIDGSTYAVTKGDANPSVDPIPVPTEMVRGKVSMILPKAGLFLSFLTTPLGFIICVLCPIMVLLLYLLASWYLDKTMPGRNFLTRDLIPGAPV